MQLNSDNINKIVQNKPSIKVYTKPTSTSKIIHFGVGGFHRAHQVIYTGDAMEKSNDNSWGLTGVGILEIDKTMANCLKEQDYNYTLMLKPNAGENSASIVRSIGDYVYAYNDYDQLIKKALNPDLAIVSMTVTEGGYNIDPNTTKFDWNSELINYDLKNHTSPKTIFGYLALILKYRKANNLNGVTLLSCDNVQHNGKVLEYTFLEFLSKLDPNLEDWTKRNCSFPNSMVDRITPKTTDQDKKMLLNQFGIEDKWPVVCEPFTQWVIEDNFVAGRPKWELAGAQFVKDVSPYEKMKLRLLNSSHQALAYLGYLHGYRYVHESAQDETIQKFLLKYIKHEVEATLDPVPGINLNEYQHSLIERFANPNIADTLQRICEFTSDRIPVFNLPAINEQINKGKDLKLSALIIASWRAYLDGVDESGKKIEIVDNKKQMLLDFITGNSDPVAFIKIKDIFHSLSNDITFVQLYKQAYINIKKYGAIKATSLFL
ncbi:mannitol dehydrogenase family protein [Francisella sp. 19X1-34]|uniref:mannitol dehydrogenase family protein n=1 Tax=Francisella sp. 19X1-34 TaxID=3087177 RepID=UPI002E34A533|nr:mannitol dehydrogenase family protein [Francisella sp. 19X1-34]MED7787727.1 mannitol dehydrogenase family protein [Francisella sp. 19X1-34]